MRALARSALLVALVATASAQPTRVGCGPAGTACGPATAGVVPGTTTSTTGGPTTTGVTTSTSTSTTVPGAPSWVNATLGAWMMNDPAGGPRVNAQGTGSRDLAEGAGPITLDTTNKMEGSGSVAIAGGTQNLYTSDTTLKAIPAPYTCGLWARPTGAQQRAVLAVNNSPSPTTGFQILYMGATDNTWNWDSQPAGTLNFTPATSLNTWTHMVIRQIGSTSQVYKDGVAAQSASRSLTTSSGSYFVVGGAASANGFVGNIDEVWCTNTGLSAQAICRICSCGLRGEQCACSGTAFTSTGRNASACGSCTLPADCSAATPP